LFYNLKMKNAKQMKFWSNIFFLIPLIISTYYGLYWYSILISMVIIMSCLFHFYNEHKIIYYFDVLFSSTIMLSNFILLFRGHWMAPYSIMAILFALTALFFYFRQSEYGYNLDHGLWHIFSSGVSTFCIITFLKFTHII